MSKSIQLKYKHLWSLVGYVLIAVVVYQTLTAHPVTASLEISDKFLHTAGYFILMGWFVQIYHGTQQRFYWALFFVAMGVALEFLQGLSGVRIFEVSDMLANGSGVLLAWALSVTRFKQGIFMFEKAVLKLRKE